MYILVEPGSVCNRIIMEKWKSQFHRMQGLLRITEQGQSLSQIVVSFLLFIPHPHVCLSDLAQAHSSLWIQ